MESLITHATDMLAWVAPDGTFLRASKPLLSHWRLDADSVSLKNLTDLVRAEDGELFSRQGLLKLFRRGGATALPVVCEAAPGQQEKALLTVVAQFDPFGVEQGLMCQFTFTAQHGRRATDTALELSDSFFKTVLNSISDAVLILDAVTMQVLAANTVFLAESHTSVLVRQSWALS